MYEYAGSGAEGLGMFVIILLLVVVIGAIFSPSKSKKYRKVMTDLYVVGRVKQLATEDSIDLATEYEEFKKFCKKQRLEEQPLDATIEEELQERVNEPKKK